VFITKARHDAAVQVERLHAAREADKNFQLSQQLLAAEARRRQDLEELGALYRQQLVDVTQRAGEDLHWTREMAKENEIGLEGRHAAELQRLQDMHDRHVTAANALLGQVLQELAATREQAIELQRALVTLRREGFQEPAPAAGKVEDIQLPAEVAAAIAEMAFSPDVGLHLERYAWEQIEAGTPPAEIARRIKQGEDPAPVRPPAPTGSGRTRIMGGKLVGELPPDAPVGVMGDPNDDDEEDDDG